MYTKLLFFLYIQDNGDPVDKRSISVKMEYRGWPTFSVGSIGGS